MRETIMITRRRPNSRRRGTSVRLPWRDIGQVALLMLAIVAVWYLAWGRYRHQPPPEVQFHFQNAKTGRVQP
ncbi:MAG: hypothetical protein KatS3mg023_0815 [Armatimonadota bacterium]|nr:MAG: hypothetical protein KatS3mg023_0815 [Armatimonadota bacterium]